ncbi:Protein of unknown function, partial [Gryllus bimaculatus]
MVERGGPGVVSGEFSWKMVRRQGERAVVKPPRAAQRVDRGGVARGEWMDGAWLAERSS